MSMGARRYSVRALFVGRGVLDTLAWVVCLLLSAFSVARAIRTGQDWGSAIVISVVTVAYTFVPWLRQAQIEREQRRAGTLTIDDWGVTRVAGALREAVAWADLVWVRVYTTSAGPAVEDVYFALGGADGKGCLVPHDLAVRSKLLDVLQARLPGFDNGQVVRAMGSTSDAFFTVWTRPAPSGEGPPPLLN
jgi:hypothetical protein